MKSILISIKPKWCALITKGDKTIEVRKNKALANAIQKLINENGYADIYVYCSKDKKNYLFKDYDEEMTHEKPLIKTPQLLNGKVVFKFRCYKVEEYEACNFIQSCAFDKTCLSIKEYYEYLPDYPIFNIYAIHISDLEIFDKPKRINEFIKYSKNHIDMGDCLIGFGFGSIERLTKAPQNMVYIEGE